MQESAARFGEDPRTFLISTKRFVGDENGHLKELHTVQIEWERDENGRFQLKEVPGSGEGMAGAAGAAGVGFPGAGRHGRRAVWSGTGSAFECEGGARDNTRPVSRASSPPAICAAGRAWWCGLLMRDAGLHASATAG